MSGQFRFAERLAQILHPKEDDVVSKLDYYDTYLEDFLSDISAGTPPASPIGPTGVTPGQYGDATDVGQFTVGADGRLTQAANVPIYPNVATAAVVLVGTFPNAAGAGNSLYYSDSWRPDDTNFMSLSSPPTDIGLLYDTTGSDPSFTPLVDGVWQFQVRLRWTDDSSSAPPNSVEIKFDNELAPSLVSSMGMSFPAGSGATVGITNADALIEVDVNQYFALVVNIIVPVGHTYSLEYWVQITRLG